MNKEQEQAVKAYNDLMSDGGETIQELMNELGFTEEQQRLIDQYRVAKVVM